MKPFKVTRCVGVSLLLVACSATQGLQTEPSHGTIHVFGSATTFGTLDDMIGASDLVIVGRVVDVSDGVFEEAPTLEDFKGTQNLAITIEFDEVLKGQVNSGERLAIGWPGYIVNSDGSRGPQQVVNDQLPPSVGDTNVWFLGNGDGGRFGLVAYEGRLNIDTNGRLVLTAPNISSGAADEVSSLTLDQLRTVVSNAR